MKTLVEAILAAWRESERIASDHPPGSREHDSAVTAAEHLRRAYGVITAASGTIASEDDSPTLRTSIAAPEEAV